MPINFVNTIISRAKIDGVALQKITIDGDTVFETSHEHAYKVVDEGEATCTAGAYKKYECEWCGDIFWWTSPALGHDWGEWEIIKEATETETGNKRRTCNRCGSVQQAIIDKDYTYTEDEDGNLSVEGNGSVESDYEIIIPSKVNGQNVNGINSNGFAGSKITAVFIEPGISRIGNSAFNGCSWLNQAYLPRSIKTIEPLAFAGCDNATIYCEAESKPEGWDDGWVDDSVTVVWGHTHANRIISVLPTCTKKGYTLSTCEVCGYKQQSSITPALGHSWKDATCTKPKTCNVCGETEGEALGHTWVEATCTTPKTCSVCGTTEGEALGHTEVSIPPVPPTCTEAGKTEGKKCSVCGEITFAPIPFPATGHTWGDWDITLAPTCTRAGQRKRTCSVCGAFETEEIPAYATAHAYSELITKEPTCTMNGVRRKTCILCGEVVEEEIFATGHDWDVDVEIVEPTCTEGGYTLHTCNACGETYKDEFTDALGHNLVDGICTKCNNGHKGVIYYGASEIPESYNSSFILGLENKTAADTHLSSINVTPLEDQYIYYCVPVSFGDCTFAYNNFVGGFSKIIEGIGFTNEGGKTEIYNIYKSNQANLGVNGAITITIQETG